MKFRTLPLFLREIEMRNSTPKNFVHRLYSFDFCDFSLVRLSKTNVAPDPEIPRKLSTELCTPPLFIRLFRRDASESAYDAERLRKIVHRLYSLDFEDFRDAETKKSENLYTAFIPDENYDTKQNPEKICTPPLFIRLLRLLAGTCV